MGSSLAVATAAVGAGFDKMGKITHPLMQAYAARCGADFVVITEPLMAQRAGLPPRYEKFQLHDLLARFDRVLFLDNDILVSPDSPNVFELVPPEVFAASSEEGFSRMALDKELTQQELGTLAWTRPYFNTGVMVAGAAHRLLFDSARPELQRWNAFSMADRRYHPAGEDQAYLNYLVNALDLPFQDLGYRFNHTRVRTDTHLRFHSHFIHYAGPSGFRYGARLEQMQKDAAVLTSPLSLVLARALPRVRWIFDRCDPAFASYLWERVRGRNA